ncbi:UNVERIFIED_CONTAM: hypothetical protein RMT77_008328 [Armadillidium vulgare]
MVYLTGRIEVVVVEAYDLLNLDQSFFNSDDKSDPYCIVSADGINGSRRIGKTCTIDDCLNPKWNYKMVADLNQDVSGLRFVVKDKDLITSELIGSCFVDTMSFLTSDRPYENLLQLSTAHGKRAGSIRVQIMYTGTGSSTAVESTVADRMKLKTEDMMARISYSSNQNEPHSGKKSVVLHGLLEVYIGHAVNLPNLDKSFFSIRAGDVSDPFIEVIVEDPYNEKWKVATTSVIDNNLNPEWDESFYINICHDIVTLNFVVKDKDVLSADLIGTVAFRAEDLIIAPEIKGEFDLFKNGKPLKEAKLSLRLCYKSSNELSNSLEVPGCFFRMRELNRMTLYQDAHCVGMPPIRRNDGTYYKQPRAWKDLYNAIMGAKEFIYIVGWSVNTRISMLRWQNEDDRSIGEILLQKANEGVQVLVMIWDELTSTDFNKEGAMGTSDEATAEFFKNTPVTVVLVSRERKTKDISTKQRFTNFCYTHHQKCVIMDGEIPDSPNRRQTVAFLGGLDLTNGRFDIPEHPLFITLDNDHKDDFYNSLYVSKTQYGPREPWHDIHCRLEGPVTQDLLSNFIERWNKQGIPKKNVPINANLENKKIIYRIPERWNVQIFRSINSDSATFESCTKPKGLSVKKERIFDNSIQRAYIHHIRRAKKYIYMENQYFMGSSHEWLDCREAHVENLVPLEIAAHIEGKIRKGERFTAYILVPMFPEGKPADKVIQEMLHWQFRTIEMMYYRIANAINDAGIEAHPQDYLLFLCLGKKEGTNPEPIPTELTGHAAGAFKHRRLMIYVHSKMAIFDDEYIIVGSANINDRSLNGNRDTEIAMGTFQPEHLSSHVRLADGEVSMFRKSLWLEHMGDKAPLNDNPADLNCIRKVKDLAEEGFLSFIDESNRKGVRHLLIYPLNVGYDGSVTTRDECPTFPDTVASIIGKKSGYLPSSLTS